MGRTDGRWTGATAEILTTGYANLMAYIVFKACEYRLEHGLTDGT